MRPRQLAAGRRALALVATALLLTLAIGPTASLAVNLPTSTVEAVCGTPAPETVRCLALRRTDIARSTRPFAATRVSASVAPAIAPLYPSDLQAAYGLTSAAASTGTGRTVAVIDAFDDPTAESDLAAYRSTAGLPACMTANGCFTKVDQNGGTSYPPPDAGWASEISLDLDMVSAICPRCSILLVEADSTSMSDLGAGVNRAVAMGAKYISNSYGTVSEYAAETSWDTAWFKHPGVVVTAGTSDAGYGVSYPAASQYVIAVGGTSLRPGASGTWTQSAWAGAGSGCSRYEAKPSWQHDTGCAKRTLADVSAVADTNTPVAVYDNGGWSAFGGTSASSPIIAAAYALAGVPAAGSYPGSYPYLRGGLTDVVGGSNGSCGASGSATEYLCHGMVGYDGPTGLGTPAGTLPFSAPGVPEKPAAVTGTPGVPGTGTVAVAWFAPASDGGSTITGYTAAASPGGASCAWTSGPLSCTVTGLSSGQAYTFTVTATTAIGTGPASDASAQVVPLGPPGPPTGVTGTRGDGQVGVLWAAPALNGGSAVTGYTVTSSPDAKTCSVAAPGALGCTVSGLTNGQSYTFTVVASNVYGPGALSSPSAPVTPVTVPGAPTGVSGTPGNSAVAVVWSAPGSIGGRAITGYTVTSSPGGQTCAWTYGPLECTVTGLTQDQPYTFTVVATNAAGVGPPSSPSAPVAPAGLPGAPTNVMAVAESPIYGAVHVTWDAPADSGGSPLTSFTAVAYDATAFRVGVVVASGPRCTVEGSPPAASCTITGLALGSPVTVRVTATSAVGTGLMSAPSAAVVPPTAPLAAVGVVPVVTFASPLVIALVRTPGTNAIKTLAVRYRRVAWNSGTWTTVDLPPTSSSSFPIALTPGYTYCFKVAATDGEGFVGPWSAERCTATPLDVRRLLRSGTWSMAAGSAYYRGSVLQTTAYGATAYRTMVQAKRISLIVTTCPTCGSVKVYLGSKLLRSVSLVSSKTVNRKVISVVAFTSVRSGTVTVKVSSSGRKVLVEGLALSRT